MVAAARRSPDSCWSRHSPHGADTFATEPSDFALLLVQEWLAASKFESTAQCLADECTALGRHVPSTASWYRLTERLGITSASTTSPASPTSRTKSSSTPMLEAVIIGAIAQHEKEVSQMHRTQQPQHQVVLMSKKPQLKEIKFVSKRFLPKVTSASTPALGNNNADERSSPLSSCASTGRLRPKSAAVCKSTPDLISKSLNADKAASKTALVTGSTADQPQASTKGLQRTVKRVLLAQQRPISAASVLTPHCDSLTRHQIAFQVRTGRRTTAAGTRNNNNSNNAKSPTTHSPPPPDRDLHGVMEAVASVAVTAAASKASARHASCAPLANLPHISEASKPGGTLAARSDSDDNDTSDKEREEGDEEESDMKARHAIPKLALEEMSEERLHEQFSSISRVAIKRLRRVLAKSNACNQEFEKSRRTLDKIHARAKLRQLRRVLAEKQTPLLSSTMAVLTTEPCSLCLHVFPKKNLTLKVSYKSILDLRASWAAANGQTSTSGDDKVPGASTSKGDADPDGGGTVEPAENESDLPHVAHLYDEASICAFCSQLVLNFSTYRPTSAERQQRLEERKEAALERQKAHAEMQRRRADSRDPLDFHSYELNSDDSDSDVEEVVEVDDAGRPHVIRRRRTPVSRVPVQLGVVSKRLHYDALRSQSLHMLNGSEWEKIIS